MSDAHDLSVVELCNMQLNYLWSNRVGIEIKFDADET